MGKIGRMFSISSFHSCDEIIKITSAKQIKAVLLNNPNKTIIILMAKRYPGLSITKEYLPGDLPTPLY